MGVVRCAPKLTGGCIDEEACLLADVRIKRYQASDS